MKLWSSDKKMRFKFTTYYIRFIISCQFIINLIYNLTWDDKSNTIYNKSKQIYYELAWDDKSNITCGKLKSHFSIWES